MKLRVDKQGIKIVDHEALVSGSVNVYKAEFEFDETWNGYERTAVFRQESKNECVKKEVALSKDACIIPWEVLEKEGRLTVGVYGTKKGYNMPTVYTKEVPILIGAGPAEKTEEPTPGIVEQLIERTTKQIGNLDDLTTKAKANLVSAINEAAKPGSEGSTQPDWAQNDETAKDFIKNRPIINSAETQVIFDGDIVHKGSAQAVTITSKLSQYIPLEVGKTYLISVNGAVPVERVCTIDSDGNPALNIWNILRVFNRGYTTYVAGFNYAFPSSLRIELSIGAKQLIDPKAISDMYFSEEDEKYVSTGVGSAGFLSLGAPDIIPKIVVKGETYENVLGKFEKLHGIYTFGPYTLDYWFDYISVETGDAAPSDFEFFKKVKTEKVHTIPEKYLPGSSNSRLTVTISEVVGSSGITYSADHTCAEIMAAIEANRDVQATYSGMIFPLTGYFPEGVIFEIATSTPPLFAIFDQFKISSSNTVERSQMEVPNDKLGISSAKAGQFVRIKSVTSYGSPVQFEAADAPSGAKGDKGDTGPQGPAGKDGAGMDVTGATVGQIAKISAVDENGVPTAWEPVDMPSGGGETWELLRHIVIPEGAAETNALTIDTDEDGKPFALKKMRLYSTFPAYTGTSAIPSYNFTMLNRITIGDQSPLCYTSGLPMPDKTKTATGSLEVDLTMPGYQVERVARFGGAGSKPAETLYYGARRLIGAETISTVGGTNMLIYPGCEFYLYGVRA